MKEYMYMYMQMEGGVKMNMGRIVKDDRYTGEERSPGAVGKVVIPI